MKMRILAIALTLAMVFGMMPTVAFAEDTEPQLQTIYDSAIHINPLYADVIEASDVEVYFHENAVYDSGAEAIADEEKVYHTDISEVIPDFRAALEQRSDVFKFSAMIPMADFDADGYLVGVFNKLFDGAVTHTGVPTQGDYIKWHYQSSRIGAARSWYSGDTEYMVDFTITMMYHTDAAQEAAVTARVDSLLAELNPTGTDYQKIKTVYDWMCSNIVYDYDNLEDYTYYLKYSAYAALINGTSVCQGYANLLYRLALEMGIDCRVITGYSANGSGEPEAHAWNIVKLGDSYYNLDATWDAPYAEHGWEYNYFLKSQDGFENHTRNADYTTSAFNAAYPMSGEDFDPSQDVVEDEEIIASGTCGINVTWKLDKDGTLTISGTGNMVPDYPAPWYDHYENIKAVVIEKGVTSIGNHAFSGCSNLATITIAESVSQIDEYAFYQCSNLVSVVIPDGVTSIEQSAFRGCSSLTNVTIPDSVVNIGGSAFYECASLTSITIPSGVTNIESHTFCKCGNLEKVVLSEGVEKIGQYAFTLCKKLKNVTIPDSVTEIGEYAFSDCSSLEEIAIPESVSTIGNGAFLKCKSLNSIVIPDGVTTIGEGMFEECYALTSITLPDTITSIGDVAFYRCNITDIYIPYGVTTIGNQAFMQCGNLTNISIPNSVTGIGDFAFLDCDSLICATIPASVMAIGLQAFEDCEKLWHVLYTGTEEQWNTITLGDGNDGLLSVTRHYNAKGDEVIAVNKTTCTEKIFCECTICGAVLSEEIPGGGHNMGNWTTTKEATCTEDGSKSRTCSKCDHTETEVIAATGHNHVPTVTAPDCVNGGYTTYTCSVCGNSYVGDEVPALNHDMGDWVITDATCTADGSKTRTCQREGCDHSETEVIAATGHNHVPTVTAPDCVNGGYTTYTCSVCGNSYVGDEVPALNHDMGDWVITDATCTADGSKTRTCQREGCDHTETEVIAATGHNHVPTVTAPTCTEKGYTTYTCACGDSYTADETAALGHDHAYSLTAAPTERASGQLTGICARCADEIGITLPKLNKDDYDYAVLTEPTEEAEGLARYIWKDTAYGVYSFDVTLNKLGSVILGDVNGDGSIGISDLMRLANHFAKGVEIDEACADVNGDGKVTIADLMRLANFFAGKAQLG